uniref:Secreted protein n=1 Tax=Haemonchus contortus TaxID=6289 RepID=W6NFT2_HAECO
MKPTGFVNWSSALIVVVVVVVIVVIACRPIHSHCLRRRLLHEDHDDHDDADDADDDEHEDDQDGVGVGDGGGGVVFGVGTYARAPTPKNPPLIGAI